MGTSQDSSTHGPSQSSSEDTPTVTNTELLISRSHAPVNSPFPLSQLVKAKRSREKFSLTVMMVVSHYPCTTPQTPLPALLTPHCNTVSRENSQSTCQPRTPS